VPPRKWAVVALLSAGMVIAYIDRANLSVVLATSEVRDTFQLSDSTRGLLNSTFFWSYALLQIPAGWIVDRYGARKPYAIGFLFWTLVSAATGLVNHVSHLVAARLLLGAGEAVGAPASLRWIRWNCPEERRGLAVGIYREFSARVRDLRR
jgi:MFS family permease